ncbi:HNH endonuclease signature motif containing protein, partial [Planotetraspora thailandica]|uniref:HNH endonuclease signature motif containing protein n=1 Tax=Planotetraspora thailandica TaxID=487172 RepID=UPI00194EF0DB
QIPLALLRQWQSDLPALGGWARLITDILRQLDHPDIHPGTGQGGVSGGEAATGPVISPADRQRRFAQTRLRRWIQMRDRVCLHPGCRAPATRAELDHTHPHQHGGPTTAANLAALCSHHHDLRDHGWQLIPTTPGHLTWISRTGHHYPAHPPRVIEPLPEPQPTTTDHPGWENDLPP